MMVSFTRFLKSRHLVRKITLPLTVFYIISLSACSSEIDDKFSKITVENVRLVENYGKLKLTGDVSVELENTLIEALKKGVPLQFSSEFRIFKRFLFGSSNLFEENRKAVLEYHGITRRFSVVLDDDISSAYYESLTEALAACLSIKDWVLVSKEIMPRDMDNTIAQVRLMLNEEALPRPISIVAASNESWQLSSGWVEVFVEAPL